MYRKLAGLLVVLFFALASALAYEPQAGDLLGRLTAPVLVGLPGGLSDRGDLALAGAIFLRNMLPLAIGLIFAFTARSDPRRRPPAWLTAVRVVVASAGAAYAAAVLFQKAYQTGTATALLAGQAHRAPLLLVGASQAPHRLLEVLALALVLGAPLFWAVRSIQVGSLSRSTFEAWVELRRLLLPAVLLLLAAAAVEVYLTPAVAGMALGQP